MGLGVTSKQEVKLRYRVRDMRSATERISDWLKEPTHAAGVMVAMGVTAVIMPPLTEPIALTSLVLVMLYGRKKVIQAPARVPLTVEAMDGSYEKPKPAEGVFFVGNEAERVGDQKVVGSRGEEVWLDNPDSRAHVFVFGTTGSGKTELLLSFLYCSLCWGSGAVYVDGKGTPKLYAQVYALLRLCGREDDARLLNYMIGRFDARQKRPQRISNRMNFLSSGSGPFLTELIVSLMPETGGDGATWKDRAINMVSGVVNSLAFLRDRGDILLRPGLLRDHLTLAKIVELAEDKEGKYQLPDSAKDALQGYLKALPGYNPQKKPEEQTPTCRDQHGYLQMQFTKTLGSLADVYGHIFNCDVSEIHMEDVVLQNRVLVVLIPSLEKSDHENRGLGNIVTASVRAMMSATMGAEVHGDYKHIIDTLPTNSPVPFTSIWDEIGYFLPKSGGTAVMPAQARSLGQQMIFAGQDMPAIVKAGKEEAEAMFGNTTLQILLKCTEPETLAMMQKRAGEATVSVSDSSERDVGGLSTTYVDKGAARTEKMQRLSIEETASYASGQGVLMFGDKVVRFRGMYSDVKPNQIRVNVLLQIRPPEVRDLENFGARRRDRQAQLQAMQGFLLSIAGGPTPVVDYIPLGGYAQKMAALREAGLSRAPHELAIVAWLRGMLIPDVGGTAPAAPVSEDAVAVGDAIQRLEDDMVVGTETNEEFDATPLLEQANAAETAPNDSTLVHDITPLAPEALGDDLTNIGVKMGVAEDVARAAADITVAEVAAAVQYPSPDLNISKMKQMADQGDDNALFDAFFDADESGKDDGSDGAGRD